MKLLTQAILKATPNFMSPDFQEKPASKTMVTAKFFNPCGAATWFMTEYDPETTRAFGYCDLGMGCPELGYFMIDELEALRVKPLGVSIERDIHWTPCSLESVMEKVQAGQHV